jgi:hypothetical protein
MGILRTKTIEPATGSTLTLGASGDTVTVSSDSIKANTFKDAGGNTLFTSDGAGTLSSINSAFVPYGPILISTSTASDSSSIDITSGIDSTYDEYMFVFTDINPDSNDKNFTFQVNATDGADYNDSAITSTVFESEHYENASVARVRYEPNDDQAQGTAFQILAEGIGNGADESLAGVFHLFNPSNTTYVKHFYATTNAYRHPDSSRQTFAAGYINDTTAIDDIRFKMSSGNFDGVIQMYGIK